MKVKVTKTFCKYVNTVSRETGKQFHAEYIEVPENAYRYTCGDVFDAYDYGDYNFNTGRCAVMVVSYPANYCACDRHVTTKELIKEFRRRGVKTVEDLRAMIIDMLEI